MDGVRERRRGSAAARYAHRHLDPEDKPDDGLPVSPVGEGMADEPTCTVDEGTKKRNGNSLSLASTHQPSPTPSRPIRPTMIDVPPERGEPNPPTKSFNNRNNPHIFRNTLAFRTLAGSQRLIP